jgi:hypothetical protein
VNRALQWLGLICLPSLVRAAEITTAAATEVRIRADRAALDDGWIEAEGPVVIDMGDQHLEGEGLRYHAATGLLQIRQGEWTRGDRILRFEEAELILADETGRLLRAGLMADGLWIEGEEFELQKDGRVQGRDVELSTCTCDTKLWSVEAGEVDLQMGAEVRFERGRLQICERSVLPIPRGRVPLASRSSGLLIPELTWGEEGARIRAPIFWTMGPYADLLVEPELRSQRGAIMNAEGRLGGGAGAAMVMGGSAGWDALEDQWRGHWRGRGSLSRGRVESSMDYLWWSDPDFRKDFEDDYLLRAEPWTDQRAHVSWGPLRLETSGTAEDGQQRLLGGALDSPGHRLGVLSVDTRTRVDIFASQQDGLLTEPRTRAESRMRASAGGTRGPVQAAGHVEAAGVAWQDSDPWAEASAGGALWVQTWGAGPGRTRLDQWGFSGSVGANTAGYEPQIDWDLTAPAWTVGPSLRSRWITTDGVPMSLGLDLPWSPNGLDPVGHLRLQNGAWSAFLVGSQETRELRLAWRDSVWGGGAGVVQSSEILQGLGWVDSPPVGPSASLRLGWSGLVDLRVGQSLSQGPYLRYSSACDCLDLRIQASWTEDRTRPIIGMQLELL